MVLSGATVRTVMAEVLSELVKKNLALSSLSSTTFYLPGHCPRTHQLPHNAATKVLSP